ncbi:MAG: hypothetical protein EA442_05195 [Candidatus Nitrosopelagicus sp.]|nr:MAG: hypothetical protein EA442_05195 [Candidatus Nitrosopelagicus sp.]
MIKYFGIGLLAIFAMMVIPVQANPAATGNVMYGILTVTQNDANGNEVLTQTIHNSLQDQGEAMIIEQVFREGGTGEISTDSQQIGAICLSNHASFAVTDSITAANFDTNDTIGDGSENNCIVDTDVDNSTAGVAVIGPLTFTQGTHMPTGTIYGIGICQANGGTSPYSNCDSGGQHLFASVDINDIVIAASETAQITYTFDVDE